MANTEFTVRLLREIVSNVYAVQPLNTDSERFGSSPSLSLRGNFGARLNDALASVGRRRGFAVLPYADGQTLDNRINEMSGALGELSRVFDLLEDDGSRDLLVELMAYRILGNERKKLAVNDGSYWERRRYLTSLFDQADEIPLRFSDWKLRLVDLDHIGYPIKLYSLPMIIHALFDRRQYSYTGPTCQLGASSGDVVIDGGGCWGDSALYFANEVGPEGRVHTFEFVPANLAIMQRNLSLNPELEARISIAKYALWDNSEQLLYCTDEGVASRVSTEPLKDAFVAPAITIDDFAERNSIEKVDFIKMDIEGAELRALKGAVEVIKTFRPKLAISVYHRLFDFVSIPEFLASLNLGYKFYLGHYTIHHEETVMFAAPPAAS